MARMGEIRPIKGQYTGKSVADLWDFGFDESTSHCGVCIPNNGLEGGKLGIIRLSRPYIENNPEGLITNTILHEIAHALWIMEGYTLQEKVKVFGRDVYSGHDDNWKAIARRVGANPSSVCKLAKIPHKFIFKCNNCGRTGTTNKTVPINSLCRKCRAKNSIVISRNPEFVTKQTIALDMNFD